jgi:hypothetical protein
VPRFGGLDRLLYVPASALLVGAIGLFDWWWFTAMQWTRYPVFGAVMTAPLLLSQVMYLARWWTLPLMRRPVPVPPRPGLRVGVATTFVPGAEPLEMLADTVAALVAMDYPHDTWVLDEGDDEAVRRLCAQLGARHFTRRHSPEHQAPAGRFERRSKHGNYNAWLDHVGPDRYDVIVGFDPDHVPSRRFLERTIGYLADDSIGYVQAAQVYYNQRASFIARGAAEETYAYYSSVQMSSYALGYPIVTGCHNVHRASALYEVGGFPAHEADDLLLTIRYRAAGWRGVYVPEALAVGLTPVTWAGYLTQQRRWARSVLDVKLRIYPRLARRLPWVERLVSLAHGLYYLYGLGTALNLALLGLMLVTGTVPGVFSVRTLPFVMVLTGGLLAADLFRQRFVLDPSERGLYWRAGLLRLAKWPIVLLALKEAVRPRRSEYALTAKTRQRPRRRLVFVPHALSAAYLVATALFGVVVAHVSNGPLLTTAGLLAAGSLVVMTTATRREPAPYDPALRCRRDPG